MRLSQLFSVARRWGRALVEFPPFGFVRQYLVVRQSVRDSLASRAIAAEHGYRELDNRGEQVFPPPGRKTLFILGGGSSVVDLTDDNFATIQENISIGINIWAVHPFIPDIYSFESSATGGGVPGHIEYLEQRINRPEVLARSPKFLLLRQTHNEGVTQIIRFPTELRSSVFVYGRANVLTTKEQNLESDLARALKALKSLKIPPNILLDNGASVARMIMLGLVSGFKKIVLVGVDLDSRPYFWHNSEFTHSSGDVRRLFPRPSGQPHDTLETKNRPFPADVFIRHLATVATSQFNCEIVAGSPDSQLSRFLPVHDWHEQSKTCR